MEKQYFNSTKNTNIFAILSVWILFKSSLCYATTKYIFRLLLV